MIRSFQAALPVAHRFVALVATSGAAYAFASVVAPIVLGTVLHSTRKVTRMASSRSLLASFFALALLGGTAVADDLPSDLDTLIAKDGLTADQAAARSRSASPDVARKQAELDAATEARIAYYEWMRARLQVLVAQRQLAQVRTTLDQVRMRTLATLREESLRLQIPVIYTWFDDLARGWRSLKQRVFEPRVIDRGEAELASSAS